MTEAICCAEDCERVATRKGMCGKHYQRMYLYGRLEKVKGIIKGNCTVDGCEEKIKGHGLCPKHYQLWRTTGRTERLLREKRSHPFYMLWFERKQLDLLCEEWLDFTIFVKAVTPKPEGYFFLVRIKADEKFGPDNFKWAEKLKREENESNRDWNAIKLEARKQANPNLESDRNIRRKYGLTREQYNEKLKQQNYVCAICKEPETSFDARTNTLRRLAVDHCHKTLKNRGLLCWRCNGTLGKIGENLELLKNIESYIIKYKEND